MLSYDVTRFSLRLTQYISVIVFVILASCGSGPQNKNDQNLPEALRELNAKLEKNPKDPSLLNERALYYVSHQQPDLALNDISSAIAHDSTKGNLYRTLSDVYFALGKYINCKEALNKAILRNPGDKEAYLKLAELALYYKDFDETFKHIDKVLEFDKVNPKAYFLRGFAHKEKGDTNRAFQNFTEASTQDPAYYDAWIELGLIAASRHQKTAIDYYQNALKVKPSSVEAFYNLGMYYQENEAYDKAIIQYSSILQIDPKNKLAPYNIGYIYLEYLHDYSKAVKYFSDAISRDSLYLDALYNRGLSYEKMHNSGKAGADYAAIIKINPEYPLAIDGLNRLDKK